MTLDKHIIQGLAAFTSKTLPSSIAALASDAIPLRCVSPTKIENTMNIKSFTAIVYKEEDMYVAECPEVGTVDQGETIEEALANLKEATKLYLEECPLPETNPRFVTSIQVSNA
jgi:predicted RNase H-like HicB family nuclease